MQVRVWNDNVHVFQQKFRDAIIRIPPKKYVLMDREEAILFKSKFWPPVLGGDDVPKPESYKMLRIERLDSAEAAKEQAKKFICHVDGQAFETEAELKAHVKESGYEDKLLKAEEHEAFMKKPVSDTSRPDKESGSWGADEGSADEVSESLPKRRGRPPRA